MADQMPQVNLDRAIQPLESELRFVYYKANSKEFDYTYSEASDEARRLLKTALTEADKHGYQRGVRDCSPDIQPQRSEPLSQHVEHTVYITDEDGFAALKCCDEKHRGEIVTISSEQPPATDDHWTTSEVLALISELESNETRADKCDAASLKYWDNGFRSAFVMLRAVMSKRQPPATDDEKYRSSCGCLVTE